MPIQLRGAHEHNLKGIDVSFGDGLTIVTGVSGSGKSSLVFDTLYHEARRRYLDLISTEANAERLAPARVKAITGLGPAVGIGQNLLNRNPNSTLATASGLHPFLRLAYARFGVRSCRRCGALLTLLTEDEVVERLLTLATRQEVEIRAPVVNGVRGSHRTLLQLLDAQLGAGELIVDGKPWRQIALDTTVAHSIEVSVGRIDDDSSTAELRAAVHRVSALGASAVIALHGTSRTVLSLSSVCVACGTSFAELRPVLFNDACPNCGGHGCGSCHDTGMHPEAANVRWGGLRLPEFLAHTVQEALQFVIDMELPSTAARLRSEIGGRLTALATAGLGYLNLDRSSTSLSRGEAQRVRLALALISRLEDMLHVLDEPTIGQHPADVVRLLPVLRQLPGPVVAVEHDRMAAAFADHVIDLGPGAGAEGGQVTYAGDPSGLWQSDTLTGSYFSLRRRAPRPAHRGAPERFLTVTGANLHNLQEIDVAIPLGRLTVVTGVSGSGKSTLVRHVLTASLQAGEAVGCRSVEGPALKPELVTQDPIGRNPRSNPATYTKLADILRDGFAAATGLPASSFSFNRPEGACPVCEGMGALEISMRYLPSTWIRCTACDGTRFSESVLEARVEVAGQRYSIADIYEMPVAEAAEWLAQAEWLPETERRNAQSILQAFLDVGLGYLPLGQPSPTLSGGEAQRVKLARTLGKRSLANRLLVLDEPSTGLHPHDIGGLLVVLDRLVGKGATVIVVEHNTDIIRAAGWIVDLGPGAGPQGGRVLYAGAATGIEDCADSITGQMLKQETELRPHIAGKADGPLRSDRIAVHGARAHNLKRIDVEFPKQALTVVTGVSGSGKSSLVEGVLGAEAHRRYLESLSMYERQGLREGPEAPVESVSGMGVTVAISPDGRRFSHRSTVGGATEISRHLSVLVAWIGQQHCLNCGAEMARTHPGHRFDEWRCPACDATLPAAGPRRFSPDVYGAACQTCHGVGSLQQPNPDKLIVRPDMPLCGGAMYSPGFFPKGYLCQPFNGGHDMVQALAGRYGFDPAVTPWQEMPKKAQQAFLFGDPEPMEVVYQSRKGVTQVREQIFPGFYGWIRDWDVGGTYTDSVTCPECKGQRLRPQYLAVTLNGMNMHQLSEMPMSVLAGLLSQVTVPPGLEELVTASLDTIRRRLRFLERVGLGYLNLYRVASTLSAGEAQRIKLAGLLGSDLTALTVLLDEPSRGLHPSEVSALREALRELCRDPIQRDGVPGERNGAGSVGNTVIMVEHDLELIAAADFIVDMGLGGGVNGGEVVAQGTVDKISQADTATGRWLRGGVRIPEPARRMGIPERNMTVSGARANNLVGDEVRIPLGALVGVCGVSGSGKSTLLIDTIGRALAPRKQTTSVAYEPIEPGVHDAIDGAPARTVVVDQAKASVTSPADFLGLTHRLRSLYAASADAKALGVDESQLSRSCSACNGRGTLRIDMGFLPDIHTICETCQGTGCLREAWQVRLRGYALPEVMALSIDQVMDLFADEEALARPLKMAQEVGLGYLVLQQPRHALSGGEAQRLKIAVELCRTSSTDTLYILDEPTVGQHMDDVERLIRTLRNLVEQGHSVVVSEHHPHLLASCDWLIELGPGGGRNGGRIIAAGAPREVAGGHTPTAPYLRELLEAAP